MTHPGDLFGRQPLQQPVAENGLIDAQLCIGPQDAGLQSKEQCQGEEVWAGSRQRVQLASVASQAGSKQAMQLLILLAQRHAPAGSPNQQQVHYSRDCGARPAAPTLSSGAMQSEPVVDCVSQSCTAQACNRAGAW